MVILTRISPATVPALPATVTRIITSRRRTWRQRPARQHLACCSSTKCICATHWPREWTRNHTACIHLKLSYHKVWKIWVISKLPDRPMSVNWCFILFASVLKFFFVFPKKLFRAHSASPKKNCSFIVELAESLPASQRSPYPTRRRKGTLTKLLPPNTFLTCHERL